MNSSPFQDARIFLSCFSVACLAFYAAFCAANLLLFATKIHQEDLISIRCLGLE